MSAALRLVDTNPVRMPVRQGRVIQVRFTDFARLAGCRSATLFGPTPDQAVQSIVRRLGVDAGELQARAQQLGDLAILRRMPADAPREYGPGTVQPVAFVEGLAQSEFTESLVWLGRPKRAS